MSSTDRFGGDVVCMADALPWEDDAFRLILVQHAGDALPSRGALIDELARVLAPGGVLLWYGLNPWSPWAGLDALAGAVTVCRCRAPAPADITRRRLLRRQLAPVSIDYVGAWLAASRANVRRCTRWGCWHRCAAPTC